MEQFATDSHVCAIVACLQETPENSTLWIILSRQLNLFFHRLCAEQLIHDTDYDLEVFLIQMSL
mgnify:FL=1